MGMALFGEFNLLRLRGYEKNFSASGSYLWHMRRDGGFLKLNAGAGGPWTLTLTVTAPVHPSPPTGLQIWVEFYQGGAGGSLVTWPGTFLFQTVGDAIPAATAGKTTIWQGIYGVGSSNCFMTKLGEW